MLREKYLATEALLSMDHLRPGGGEGQASSSGKGSQSQGDAELRKRHNDKSQPLYWHKGEMWS